MISVSIKSFAKAIIPFSIRIGMRRMKWAILYHFSTAKVGSQIYCPISGKNYKGFIQIGSHLISPETGAMERHRILWLYIKNQTTFFSNSTVVLHFAPEYCLYREIINVKNWTYIPADIGSGYPPDTQKLDITQIALEDESVNLIICNHVLEHISNDKIAMAELYRVLAPNGLCLITVPIREDLDETYENQTILSPKERAIHFGQWDHVRWYSLDILDRLTDVGFRVSAEKYGLSFSKRDQAKYGLNDEFLFIAQKL